MSRLSVAYRGPLEGHLYVQGSKNAALPCIAAALLHRGTTVLEGIPLIGDVYTAIEIASALGAQTALEGHTLVIRADCLSSTRIPDCFMRRMRSSIIFMGALLAAEGSAEAAYPGGCVLGERPVDYHLEGFRKLGCEIEECEGKIRIRASSLRAARICLPFPSVGATQNLMLAASAADGVTVIENAAKEPEIIELADLLNQMGILVTGAGGSCLCIKGKCRTKDSVHQVSGDRIAAGTWILCALNSGGSLELDGAPVEWMTDFLNQLRKIGVSIMCEERKIFVHAPEQFLPIPNLKTAPYPGFPTDMQSQLLPLLARACGNSCIYETVFSKRFRTVFELKKMGADITILKEKNAALIRGSDIWLTGTKVEAPDLRGAAALMIAGLHAKGETVIENCCHLERGYENPAQVICFLGGKACLTK